MCGDISLHHRAGSVPEGDPRRSDADGQTWRTARMSEGVRRLTNAPLTRAALVGGVVCSLGVVAVVGVRQEWFQRATSPWHGWPWVGCGLLRVAVGIVVYRWSVSRARTQRGAIHQPADEEETSPDQGTERHRQRQTTILALPRTLRRAI